MNSKTLDRNVLCVWESPTNEGSESFRVGVKSMGYTWVTGRIEHPDALFAMGVGGEVRVLLDRVEVYDTDGNLRISLPATACAVEYEPTDD